MSETLKRRENIVSAIARLSLRKAPMAVPENNSTRISKWHGQVITANTAYI